jgi:hypothetical protein
MAQADQSLSTSPPSFSRRFFLRGTGTATAAVIAPSIAESASTGPISPAEWWVEMRALGWSAASMVYCDEPRHVVEYCRRDDGVFDHEKFARTFAARRELNGRVDLSGPEFWKRAARLLFDKGLRVNAVPLTNSGEA